MATTLAERDCSAFDVERALTELAIQNGNLTRAARTLSEDPDAAPVSREVLKGMRDRNPDRYADIRAEILPRIRERAADQHMALAEKSMKIEAKIAARMLEQVDEIPARDLPGAQRNVATTIAIHSDKAQMFNDQPTQRVAIDLQGVLQELKSLGVDPKVALDPAPQSEQPAESGQIIEAEVVDEDAAASPPDQPDS